MFDPSKPRALTPAPPNSTTLYQHPSGKAYLVRSQADGQINFVPLETALTHLTQPSQPQSERQHDPIALLLMSIAVAFGIAVLGYFLGFLAGGHGRETVVVPRSPICRIEVNSFLFWRNETQNCQ